MIRKHSVTLHGHRTSLSIEDEFWRELQLIAESKGMPLAGLVAAIDEARTPDTNLSSAVRIHILKELQKS